MKTRHVIVVPYDEEWQTAFLDIEKEIRLALGELAIRIEHVGSTSVEGLAAKPCIDLDVVIEDYSVFDAVRERLALIGYRHEGDLGISDREAFAYSGKPHLMAHHLYVCPKNSRELHRHIVFRDFLRSHRDYRKRYGETKIKAAELFPNDIDGYIKYKSDIISEIYKLCEII